MRCPKCQVENPEGKRFCGDCGTSLDVIAEEFRQNVKSIFRQELRDQKLVEIEIADQVINRLKTMFKPAMYAAGFALALTGFIGFRSVTDFSNSLTKASNDAVQQLRTQAASESSKLAKEADAIRQQQQKAGDVRGIEAKLREAEDRLQQANARVQSVTQNANRLRDRYEQTAAEFVAARETPATTVPGRVSGSVSSTSGRSPSQAGGESLVYAVGSSGQPVTKIQTRLRELNCFAGQPQGTFDSATRAAVVRFHEARGDPFGPGLVDAATWDALFAAGAPRCR